MVLKKELRILEKIIANKCHHKKVQFNNKKQKQCSLKIKWKHWKRRVRIFWFFAFFGLIKFYCKKIIQSLKGKLAHYWKFLRFGDDFDWNFSCSKKKIDSILKSFL